MRAKPRENSPFLRLNEVFKELNVCKTFGEKLIRMGKLPVHQFADKVRRVHKDDLRKFIEQSRA